MIRQLEHSGPVNSLAFSPDGRTLTSGTVNAVRLWDTRTGDLKQTLTGHSDGVYSVTFSPDGKAVASGSKDSSIRLWNVAQGAQIKKLESGPVSTIAFSPDGKLLASAGEDGAVALWSVR
jgi:WD40 repeat protein